MQQWVVVEDRPEKLEHLPQPGVEHRTVPEPEDVGPDIVDGDDMPF